MSPNARFASRRPVSASTASLFARAGTFQAAHVLHADALLFPLSLSLFPSPPPPPPPPSLSLSLPSLCSSSFSLPPLPLSLFRSFPPSPPLSPFPSPPASPLSSLPLSPRKRRNRERGQETGGGRGRKGDRGQREKGKGKRGKAGSLFPFRSPRHSRLFPFRSPRHSPVFSPCALLVTLSLSLALSLPRLPLFSLLFSSILPSSLFLLTPSLLFSLLTHPVPAAAPAAESTWGVRHAGKIPHRR